MSKHILLLLIFGFLLIGTAQAASFTVNNNADTSDMTAGDGICADALGNCTLRAAVEEANSLISDDSIGFAANLMNTPITLMTGVEISVSSLGGNLQINGLGADKLTIDGGAGSNRVFNVGNSLPNNATVTITGVTIQGGGNTVNNTGADGGAINARGGTLVLNKILVQNNYGGNGGGILITNVNCNILNSSIVNNFASNGGGFYQSVGTLFVANTTFSGNTLIGNGQGGGMLLNGGAATFRNATITNNYGGAAGGGVEVFGNTFSMGNTIIAGNTAGGNPEILSFNAIVSAGNNFIGDSPGDSTSTNVAVTYQMSDIRDQNPFLGTLQNNGGTTPTHALMMPSPAINAGDNQKAVNPFDNSPLTADQRAYTPRIVGGTVDIGAYEFNAAPTAASVSVSGQVLAGKRGVSRAVIYLTDANGATRKALTNSFGYYRLDDVEVGQTYIFSVSHKRYSFAPQVLSVIEEMNGVNFSAN